RSHWSTSKTPSYTKSVSWQHHHKIGEHTVEIDADCMILSVDGSPATLNASVSGHMDFNLANGGIAESEPRPNRHTCKVYAGSDVRTIHIKEQTQ
ncbi:hypothetical protein, partial [Klebsiella pneumoniae]